MNYLFLLLILLSFSLQIRPREITVTLLTAEGQPIIAEAVQFFSEEQIKISECTTSTQGHCIMLFQSSDSIIRGSLTTSYGQRPLTFKTNVAVTLTLNDLNELITPHDIYVTRTPASSPTAEPETTAEKPTSPPTTEKPTSSPTTEKPTSSPTTEKPTSPPTTEKPTNPPTAAEEAESFESTLTLNIRLVFLTIGTLIITIAIAYLNIKIKKQ